MATEIDIINQALIRLGEATIVSRSDANKRARIADATFDDLRDFVLQDHAWNFATERLSLMAGATPPEHGFARAFPLPLNTLRVLDVQDSFAEGPIVFDGPRSTLDPWKVENLGGMLVIATDLAEPLEVTVICRVTDLSIAPPMFRDALAQYCAAQWAESITGTNTVKQDMLNEYVAKISAARSADGREGSLEKAQVRNSWVDQR